MAQNFAIMRGQKLKTGEFNASISHVTRSQPTPNADGDRRDSNYSIVGPAWDDAAGIRAAVEERTPEKFRKNSVRLLEFVVTASPDFFSEKSDADERRYFESAVDFFKEIYGSDNLVSAVVHRDEKTPHMHLYVVPVDPETGRLNAKKVFGGRGEMSRRQTQFAAHLQEFGVVRGKRNPARSHTQVRDWYRAQSDLDEREAAIAAREQRFRDQQAQLSALGAEISQRGKEVSQRESTLRESVERAKTTLGERSQKLGAAAERFQQQRAQWLAANRPPDVPPIVKYLRELLDLGRLDRAERLDELDAAGVFLYDYCDADGLTPQGQALLQQHSGTIEQQQRFDEIFAQQPQPGPSGPSR